MRHICNNIQMTLVTLDKEYLVGEFFICHY
jgi:hypothetical protein